jgi:hypothetical protein
MTQQAKITHSKRWWDVWIAIFTMGAIFTVATRLTSTEWTKDFYILLYLSLIAGVAGLALGFSQFPPWLTAIFSALYGAFSIAWLLGTTVEIEMTWRERIIFHIGWRLRIAIEQFSAGQTITDSILFTTIMAVLLWIIASSAAFTLMRQGSTWLSIIPLGLTLFVVGHFDQDLTRNTRALLAFLFFALLIVGRATFLGYRKKWRQEGIQTTGITQTNFSKTLVIVVIATLVIAWIIPTTPAFANQNTDLFKSLRDQWDNFAERIADIFVVDNTTTSTTTSLFSDSMDLGRSASLGEDIVFIVTADTKPPTGYRHYWRVRSYDHYDNARWSTSLDLTEKELNPEGFDIQYPDWDLGRPSAYTFTSFISTIDYVYFTGKPMWVSRSVAALTQSLPDFKEDLIALNSDSALYAGETYHLISRISIPSAQALRDSSTDYPDWLDAYLQIPADLSPDVFKLSSQITSGYDNPYDSTFAVTRYLRSNIEYAYSIPAPPTGIEPIEWFLFQSKTGFCNYYATAQVLMLRSLGIPARIAVGYAQGDHEPQTNTYTVRKLDLHAWPEVYFMNYGWVSFEPTQSQRDIFFYTREQTVDESSPIDYPDYYQMRDFTEEELAAMMGEVMESDSGEVADPFQGPSEELTDSAEELTAMMGEEMESDSGEVADPARGPSEEMIDLAEQPVMENAGKPFNKRLFALSLLAILLIMVILLRYPDHFNLNIDPLPILIERSLDKREKKVPKWLRRWSYVARMSSAEKAYQKLGQSIKIMGSRLHPSQTPTERALTLLNLLPTAKRPIQEILIQYHLDQFSTHRVSVIRAQRAGRLVRNLAVQARLRKLLHL